MRLEATATTRGVLGDLPAPPLATPPAVIQTLIDFLPGLGPSYKVISLPQCGNTKISINLKLIPKSVFIYSGCHDKRPQTVLPHSP